MERHFHIPGQDLVWRYVTPGPTALEGGHSTMAKCASSAMIHLGRRFENRGRPVTIGALNRGDPFRQRSARTAPIGQCTDHRAEVDVIAHDGEGAGHGADGTRIEVGEQGGAGGGAASGTGTRRGAAARIPPRTGGGVATRDQLYAIADVIMKKCPPDVRIYSDEIYENTIFDNQRHFSIASVPGMESRTIIASAVGAAEPSGAAAGVELSQALTTVATTSTSATLTVTEPSPCATLDARFDPAILAEGPDTVAMFLAEPVQGAGGVIVPPPGYHRRTMDVCRKYGVLYISDEVVTAFGRLGYCFASEDVFGIQPEEHLEATSGAPIDNPVGTGPYALDEWVRGDSVVYARNDAYYDTDNLWNYETGVRKAWSGGRVTTDFTIFYLDWTDIQLDASASIGPETSTPSTSRFPSTVTAVATTTARPTMRWLLRALM